MGNINSYPGAGQVGLSYQRRSSEGEAAAAEDEAIAVDGMSFPGSAPLDHDFQGLWTEYQQHLLHQATGITQDGKGVGMKYGCPKPPHGHPLLLLPSLQACAYMGSPTPDS